MSYYAAQNPYRNSTGGLNHSRSPARTQIIVPVRPPSPAESTCSSCDSSLPLNTPWSGSGTQLDQLHLQNERVCTRSRRLSAHSDGHPAPLIIRGHSQRISTGPLSAPLTERHTYRSDRSGRALLVPASSIERSIDRHRVASTSRSGYTKYHHAIELLNDNTFESGTEVGRRGRTRFPRKMANREAAEEMGLPWTEESDGALVVLRALDRTEIKRLVDLTEEIRRRRNGPGKSVSFTEEAIIHDLIPYAPSPPPTITEQRIIRHYPGERPSTPLTSESIAHLNNNSFSHTTTTTTTTTTEEPILIPIHGKVPGAPLTKITTTYTTPSFLLPQGSLSRAEEKAIRAEEKALKLEAKADFTGSSRDEHEAYRARVKAEEKKKRFEEKGWKERARRGEREPRHMEEREIIRTKTRRGETVIIR